MTNESPPDVRCSCELGCNAPWQPPRECAMHGTDTAEPKPPLVTEPEVRPTGRTLHNLMRQRRVIS